MGVDEAGDEAGGEGEGEREVSPRKSWQREPHLALALMVIVIVIAVAIHGRSVLEMHNIGIISLLAVVL